MTVANKTFDKAKQEKEDEFYTQLNYIEDELRHYKQHFSGKVVFCNCDDPYESNFFKYFAMNFNSLGLKKLITTCYATSPVTGKEFQYYVDKDGQLSFMQSADSTPVQNERKPYKVEITEVKDNNGDGRVDLSDVEYLMRDGHNTMTLMKGDGDFRSAECIELLKEADIVVTNPPFSLFREYVAQLIEYDKKFLIIGNQNAITYKDIFKLIMENKLWQGYHCGDMEFVVPDYYKPRATRFWIDEKGVKHRSLGNICWFTNLDIQKRHENLPLYRTYNQEDYPCYENYDAINVDKVSDIPVDYTGNIGVPITFLGKYNPDQFKIIALGITGSINFSNERKMEILSKGKPTGKYTINAKGTLYRKFNPQKDKKPAAFRDVNDGTLYSSIYARIIIRRKQG